MSNKTKFDGVARSIDKQFRVLVLIIPELVSPNWTFGTMTMKACRHRKHSSVYFDITHNLAAEIHIRHISIPRQAETRIYTACVDYKMFCLLILRAGALSQYVHIRL